MSRRDGDRLHVAGTKQPPVNADLALHHRRVRHDRALDVRDDMHSTDRVLPVLLGEALVGVVGIERCIEDQPDRGDLGAVSADVVRVRRVGAAVPELMRR